MVKLSESAELIAKSRYFLDGEDWNGCALRAGYTGASVEDNPKKWIDLFSEAIYEQKFLPAGRILRNSGRIRGSLLNCFHIAPEDSIESIGNFLRDSLILWSEGGGVGTTLSNLRPNGAKIISKGGESSGPISFLQAADACASTIESGGSRRAAGLAELCVSHPDILSFIDSKSIDKLLSYFNISVGITEDFLDCVESDGVWSLEFNNQKYTEISAVKLWNKIIANMYNHAEPGLLNLDNLHSNNSYYFSSISGVNPCGEASLDNYGSCDLGSIILPSFVSKTGLTNWKELERIIYISIRFLDNILDANKYTLEKIKLVSQASRRIGLGVMGLAEYLFAKKVRYGSQESIYHIEKLMKFIRNTSYKASIELAKEKGSFPKFDAIAFNKAHFVKTLPISLKHDIKKYGIRNCTLLAMPPTGTTSLLVQNENVSSCTGGIEPLFAKGLIRKDRISERPYIHPLCKKFIAEKTPDWFVDSKDLTAKDHLEVQSIIQKYVDGSVSKTINLPKDSTLSELRELMLLYIRDLKGVTVYRDGSRSKQVLYHMNNKELIDYLKKDDTYSNKQIEESVMCHSGKCDI